MSDEQGEECPGEVPGACDAPCQAAEETLPFCVPKCPPKYVLGFPDFLTDRLRKTDPNIGVMKRTWKDMAAQHWEDFRAVGKKRKTREKHVPIHEGNVTDIPETEPPKVHPAVRTAIRRRIATLQRIADEMNSEEMREVLKDLRQLIAS
jgi:hypothetical protein